MLFACSNNSEEVRNFLEEKNLPIAIGKISDSGSGVNGKVLKFKPHE